MSNSKRARRRHAGREREARQELTQRFGRNSKDQLVLDLAVAAEKTELAASIKFITMPYLNDMVLFREFKTADFDLIEENIKNGADHLAWWDFAYKCSTGVGHLKDPSSRDFISSLLYGEGVNYLYKFLPAPERVFRFGTVANKDIFTNLVHAIRKYQQLPGILEWLSMQGKHNLRQVDNSMNGELSILLAAFADDNQIQDVIDFIRTNNVFGSRNSNNTKTSLFIRHLSLNNFINLVDANLMGDPASALAKNTHATNMSYLDYLAEKQNLLPLFDWMRSHNIEFDISHIARIGFATTSNFQAHTLIKAGRLEEFFSIPLKPNTELDIFAGHLAECIDGGTVISDVHLAALPPKLWASICAKGQRLVHRPHLQMRYLLAPAKVTLQGSVPRCE